MVLQSVYFIFATAFLQAVVVSGDNCTNNNLGIIGGHKVTVQDAPFIVALFYYKGNANESSVQSSVRNESSDYEPFCGGSIIHERFILTAATCPYYSNFLFEDPAKRVLIGTDRLNEGGLFIDVEKEFCYGTSFDSLKDDICLLKLKEPIQFGCKAAKVELPGEDFELEEGTLLNVTGYGESENDESMANELQQTTIPILSDECCFELYNVNVTEICAASHGHDSFLGDIGGPLTYNGIQVGVVSHAEYYQNSTVGVYTRVSSYVKWIKTTIEENV